DQVAVGGGEVDGIFVDRRTAVADVEGVVLSVLVVPELLAGVGVDGPEVVGRGDVDDAARDDGRGLDLLAALPAPDLFELADIFRRDPGEFAVALAGVVAVVGGPGVGGRVEHGAGVYVLRADRRGCKAEECGNWNEVAHEGLLQTFQVCVDIVHVGVCV